MPAPVDAGVNYTHPALTAFAYNTDGSTWLTVADLIKVQGPGIKFKFSDSTNLSSAALTSTLGWREEGLWEFEVYMVAAVVTTLLGLVTAKTYCNFRLQYPLILAQVTRSMFTWSGYFAEFMPNAQEKGSDDKIRYTMKGNAAQGTALFTAGS